jgi:hypothetical protein
MKHRQGSRASQPISLFGSLAPPKRWSRRRELAKLPQPELVSYLRELRDMCRCLARTRRDPDFARLAAELGAELNRAEELAVNRILREAAAAPARNRLLRSGGNKGGGR